MSALSDFYENIIAQHLGDDVAPSLEDTYVALYTDVVNDAGTGTEVTGGSYARQIVNQDGLTGVFWDVVTNNLNNNSELAFPQATANWGVVVSYAVMDAVAAGNQLWHGLLGSNPQIATGLNTGDIFHCAAHGLALDDPIVFETVEGATALPGSLVEGTEYYARTILTDSFQISATPGGAAFAITTDGLGRFYDSEQRDVKTNDTFKLPATTLSLTIR